MDSELIIISEYCSYSNIEQQFITLLEDEGLIEIQQIQGEQYLSTHQLNDIERYARWHYDLSINIEGIDAIQMLLKRIEGIQNELDQLRRIVNINSNDTYADY